MEMFYPVIRRVQMYTRFLEKYVTGRRRRFRLNIFCSCNRSWDSLQMGHINRLNCWYL